MVKTPKSRHSRPRRESLTIELDPQDVSHLSDAQSTPEDPTPFIETTDAMQTATKPGDDMLKPEGQPESSTLDPVAPSEAMPEDQSAESADERSSPDWEKQTRSTPLQDDSFETLAQRTPPPLAPPPGKLSPVLAGVIGAVAALIGAGGLQFAGLLGSPGSPGPSGAPSQEISQLRQELAAMKESAGGSELATRLDGLASQQNAIKSELASFRSGQSSSGDTVAMQALDDRVKQLEADLAAARQVGGDGADLTALNERIASLEAQIRANAGAASSDQSRMASLEQSVAALSGRVESGTQQPQVALALSASALKAAANGEEPFIAELSTFALLAPDAPGLADLRKYAETGAPSRQQLMGEFESAATAMIAAARPVDPDASVITRLADSASALVSIRPVGAPEGSGVPETVARLETALSASNLELAWKEFASLPEAVQTASGEFGVKLKARHDVDSLINQLIVATKERKEGNQ